MLLEVSTGLFYTESASKTIFVVLDPLNHLPMPMLSIGGLTCLFRWSGHSLPDSYVYVIVTLWSKCCE